MSYNRGVATQKQVRRDRKRRVHGALESDADVKRPVTSKPVKKSGSTMGRGSSGRTASRGADGVITMGRRKIYPATLKRTLRRVLIFVPFFFVLVHFMVGRKGGSLQSDFLVTGLYSAAAIPITYFLDKMLYTRMARKLSG